MLTEVKLPAQVNPADAESLGQAQFCRLLRFLDSMHSRSPPYHPVYRQEYNCADN